VISEEGRGEEKKRRENKEEEEFEAMRRRLVNNLGTYLLLGEKVREAMLRVPRHKFVPEHEQKAAYMDRPLDIGHGQTISAPHMVAIMCELLELSEGHKVLEIGAGSGYNAAVMGVLVGKKGHVYTVERIEGLANFARENLRKQNIKMLQYCLKMGQWRGRAPLPGEVFRLPEQGETLRLIGESNGETFYRGELAEKIARHSETTGGYITYEDLTQHRAEWVEPILLNYRGFDIWEIPPTARALLPSLLLAYLKVLISLHSDTYPKMSFTWLLRRSSWRFQMPMLLWLILWYLMFLQSPCLARTT